MSEASELSDTKRALLEKLVKGDVSASALPPGASAQHIEDSSTPACETDGRVDLVPIQPSGSQPPLFYLHVHWIGGAFYTFDLSRVLGPDQPLYVINPYRYDGLRVPASIEVMAAAYIEAMRVVQPAGPYRLAAFCGGSLIAYEMAQQLQAQGQEVDVLIMIEPMAGPIGFIRLIGRAVRLLGALLHIGSEQQVDWFLRVRYISRVLRRKRDEYTEHADRLLQRWRDQHPRRFSLMPAAEALRTDWMSLHIWAVSEYVPRPYAGRITYLFAQDNPDRRRLWWGTPTESDSVRIYLTPGTHTTCRTDYLPALANWIRMCLQGLPE